MPGESGRERDELWLDAWLSRTVRAWRLQVLGFVLIAVVGFGYAWPWAGVAALLTLGWFARDAYRESTILARVEATVPPLRNALVAWTETRHQVAPAIEARMARQARRALTDAPAVRPFGPRAWGLMLLLVAAAMGASVVWPTLRGAGGQDVGSAASAAPDGGAAPAGAFDWQIAVTEPAYTRRPARTLARPSRVDVIEGARLDVRFTGWPPGATATMGREALAVGDREEAHAATIRAGASDILLVRDVEGRVLATVAIVVRPDAAPQVRITAPGTDLRRATATGVVAITVEARDDFGVRDLRLRFTKVSGSGESFTFEDGEWPLAVTPESGTTWRGAYAVDLSALALAAGDSVAYYAVAHDARAGADGAAESERFLIEIAREGETAGGDFSLPEPEDKFALSQRMIIQLTERLLQRRPRMTREAYVQEAQVLSVAQRRVRAEFVFMLGGEVQDEVEEAEHSHEVESGRLDNRGQSDLTRAVREMMSAETRLTDAALDEALPYEYRALEALQAAFGKARYFMRTLPVQIRIDPDRRLQGDRAEAAAARWARAPVADADRAAALDVLRRLEAMAPGAGEGIAALLPDVIAIDRANPEWIALAQQASDAAGVAALSRALRARLAAASAEWLALPMPSGAVEASLERGGSTKQTGEARR